MTFLRYILIQLLAYVIDISFFWVAINTISPEPIFSNILSKVAAGSFAVFAHKNFTFIVDKEVKNKKLIFKYFLLLGLNIPLASVFLFFVLFFIDWPVIAKIISDVIYFIANYLLCRFYIFSSDSKYNLHTTKQLVEK